MKKILRYGVLIGAIALAACNGSSSDAHTAPSTSLQLNDGQKWKMDAPMLAFIRQMEQQVQQYKSTQQTDYKQLAQSLQGLIDQLTANCTMKGAAHDELHKWLLPFIETVDKLAAANPDAASSVVAEIEASFATFNQYFS